MGLVLKSEQKSRTFLDISEKINFFLLKNLKVHFLYFAYIFAKKRFILKKFITKMISEKSSTNPESFNKFGRGRRIHWRIPVERPICVLSLSSSCVVLSLKFVAQQFIDKKQSCAFPFF